MENFLFVDLAGLTPGKPFAGFAAGSFVDMNGREVEFKASALGTFIANTRKAIEAAVAKGMPGLPIDARQHDKGDAAGWIVDASAGEVEDSDGNAVPVIMLAAEWTKLGLELLRDRLLANFSPTVDLRAKVIRGGSLTNWPASVDGNGAPLFPAVELAAGMRRIGKAAELEESVEDRLTAIRDAWYKAFGRDGGDGWVVETFDDYVIAVSNGRTYRVGYAQDGDDIAFDERDDWVEVEQAWLEAQIGRRLTDAELGKRPGKRPSREGNGTTPATVRRGESEQEEVINMELTKEELAAVIGAQVRAELAALQGAGANQPPVGGDKPEFNALDFLEMSGAGDDVVSAFKAQMLEQYEGMKRRATVEAAEMIAKIRRESDIAEFAQLVTGGTPDVPYGLPVGIDDLKEFLSRLQPTDYEFAKKLLGDVQAHGRQKFAELGHGKRSGAVQALPREYVGILREHVRAGGDIEEWFALAGIGEAAEYDLSQFSGEKK